MRIDTPTRRSTLEAPIQRTRTAHEFARTAALDAPLNDRLVLRRWSFEQTKDYRWRWCCVDAMRALQVESPRSFSTYTECVLDAMRHAMEHRRAADEPATRTHTGGGDGHR